MISFALDQEQELIQSTVREFARAEVRPRLRAWEKAREVEVGARRKFHELGLALVDVPEALGGGGASALTAALVHEELAWGDAGAAVALWTPSLAAAALVELGGPEQARRWIAKLDGAESFGALAWSEKGGPIAGFSTVAERNGDGWTLHGKKCFVTNGANAHVTVVLAQIAGERDGWDGVGAFVVGAGAAGMRAGDRHATLGLESVHASEVILEGVHVPDEDRLRVEDFPAALRRLLERASLLTAARQVGLARAAYEVALDYTQDRKAFGKPVAHFQSIAFTLADMLMDVESARWMVWRAAVALEGKTRSPLIAAAAVHANEAAWRVADNAVQLLGGAGYCQDFPVEKWLRDTKTLALVGPPSELSQLHVASHELGHTVGEELPSGALQPMLT